MTRAGLTQEELRQYVAEGRDHIWQTNTLWQIVEGRGGNLTFRRIHRNRPRWSGDAVTQRGRFHVMERDYALRFVREA